MTQPLQVARANRHTRYRSTSTVALPAERSQVVYPRCRQSALR